MRDAPALQKLDVLFAELDREPALEALVGAKVGVEGLFSGRVHDHHAGYPGRGHLGDDQLDDGRVDDGEKLLWDRAADRKEACAQSARGDHAVPHRLQARRAFAHGRVSALRLKATGSVVRTANPVTARSAGDLPTCPRRS